MPKWILETRILIAILIIEWRKLLKIIKLVCSFIAISVLHNRHKLTPKFLENNNW